MALFDEPEVATRAPSGGRRLAMAVSLLAILAIAAAGAYLALRRSDGETDEYAIRIVTVASGLPRPWSVAFLPDGDLLLTEKWTGRLRLVHQGVLQAEPVPGVPAVHAQAQGGLLEVALHPRFAENRWVYLTYSKPGDRGSTTALARGSFDGRRLIDVQDLFVADAWSHNNGQYGSRLAFGSDGLLYMTVGDRRDQPKRAQDLGEHAGKVLRLRQRIRDVRQGPDGLLYLVTDEDAGAVLRIEPAP